MIDSLVAMKTLALLLVGMAGMLTVRAADELTVYELLAPATHQFAIVYDVSTAREGAQYFFNPIRPGSVSTKERVIDRATGVQGMEGAGNSSLFYLQFPSWSADGRFVSFTTIDPLDPADNLTTNPSFESSATGWGGWQSCRGSSMPSSPPSRTGPSGRRILRPGRRSASPPVMPTSSGATSWSLPAARPSPSIHASTG